MSLRPCCSSGDRNKWIRDGRENLGAGVRAEKPSEKRPVDSTGSAVPIGVWDGYSSVGKERG
jgi:hypothetical protein